MAMTELPHATRADDAAGDRSVRRYVLQGGVHGRSPQHPVVATGRPWPPSIPLHRAIIAVDIVGSTKRANPGKARLRQLMYSLLNETLRTSGIAERHRDRLVDRGDGALILIHPSDQVPKTLLLQAFIPTLHQLLADHNVHHTEHAFQLRVAVHAGEVHYDEWGPFGEAVDITCRLLDAPEFKRKMTKSVAPIALVVSDGIYSSIIKHGYDGIDPRYDPIVRLEISGAAY